MADKLSSEKLNKHTEGLEKELKKKGRLDLQ